MKNSSFMIIACIALAGCVSEGPRQAVTEVTFSSQSSNPLFGYDETLVQVVAPKSLKKVISVIKPQDGVPCRLNGVNYSANFTTPGKVLLPDYGSKSGPVTVTCVYQGVTRSQTVSAFDATARAAGKSAAGDGNSLGGILAGALAESVVAIDRKGKNDWAYPTIQVSYQSLAK